MIFDSALSPIDPRISFVGGCIRIDRRVEVGGKGLYIHENATHASVGLRAVYLDREYIHVSFASKGAIIAPMVGPDETVAGTKGIIGGGSGGGGFLKIKLYDTRISRTLDLSLDSDYDRVASTYSNLWFTAWHIAA